MIIDRFENDVVVIELNDNTFINLPQQIIPTNAKEGDILKINIDEEETLRRKEGLEKLLADLW